MKSRDLRRQTAGDMIIVCHGYHNEDIAELIKVLPKDRNEKNFKEVDFVRCQQNNSLQSCSAKQLINQEVVKVFKEIYLVICQECCSSGYFNWAGG